MWTRMGEMGDERNEMTNSGTDALTSVCCALLYT
jgi:hypothetical protein